MERVHGLRRIDVEVEVVAGLGVVNRDRHAIRLGLPEQRDLETVVRAEVQFKCLRARHVCLLSALHCELSVPSWEAHRYAARRCLSGGKHAAGSSLMRTSKKRIRPGG